ncbi:MAG: tetratricopeptide repeat protein [Candidatus Thorarchaeota archaeon]
MGATRLHELKRAVDEDPENVDKWYELGKFAADRFVVGISEKALTKVVKERPSDPNVLSLLGKALNRRRKLAEAEKVYKRGLELSPKDLELLTGLAVVYGNLGEQEKSIEYHKKVLAIDPGYPWSVHACRFTLEALGRINEIDAILKRALEVNPESALVNINYGTFLRETRRVAESQEYLEKAIKVIDHADPEEQSRTLRVLMDLENPQLLNVAERLFNRDRDHVDLLCIFASLLGDTKPDEAKALLQKALADDPENVRIMGHMMPLYLRTRDILGVMDLKQKMEASKPEDGLLNLLDLTVVGTDAGGLLTSEEKRDKLVESVAVILKRAPGRMDTNIRYLETLLTVGRKDEAIAHIQHMIDNVPMHDVKEVLNFGRVLQKQNLFTEAQSVFQRAESIAQTPLEKMLVKLVEYAHMEKYIDIANLLEAYIEKDSSEPIVYAILGRVQSYTDHPDAIKNLRVAADVNHFDSKILLASLLMKENDDQHATKLLRDVLDSSESSRMDKVRSLLGLGDVSQATAQLEQQIQEALSDVREADPLYWHLLLQIRKRDGYEAVEAVATRMFETHSGIFKESDEADVLGDIAIKSLVKNVSDEVMTGILAGKIKHALFIKQVDLLLEKAFGENTEWTTSS